MRRALPAYTVPEPEPGGPIWACQRIRLTAGGGVCDAPAAAVKGKAGIPGTPYSNSGDTILNSCRRREGVIEAWHGAYRAGSGEGPPAPRQPARQPAARERKRYGVPGVPRRYPRPRIPVSPAWPRRVSLPPGAARCAYSSPPSCPPTGGSGYRLSPHGVGDGTSTYSDVRSRRRERGGETGGQARQPGRDRPRTLLSALHPLRTEEARGGGAVQQRTGAEMSWTEITRLAREGGRAAAQQVGLFD